MQMRYAFHHLAEYVLGFFLPVVAQTGDLVQYLLSVYELHDLMHLLLDGVDEYLYRFDHVLVVYLLRDLILLFMHSDLLIVFLSNYFHCQWVLLCDICLLEAFVHCRVHALPQLDVQVVKRLKALLFLLGEVNLYLM